MQHQRISDNIKIGIAEHMPAPPEKLESEIGSATIRTLLTTRQGDFDNNGHKDPFLTFGHKDPLIPFGHKDRFIPFGHKGPAI